MAIGSKNSWEIDNFQTSHVWMVYLPTYSVKRSQMYTIHGMVWIPSMDGMGHGIVKYCTGYTASLDKVLSHKLLLRVGGPRSGLSVVWENSKNKITTKTCENQWLHPGRLTWNLKITYLKRKIIFQTSIIMFHVNLRGCVWGKRM